MKSYDGFSSNVLLCSSGMSMSLLVSYIDPEDKLDGQHTMLELPGHLPYCTEELHVPE